MTPPRDAASRAAFALVWALVALAISNFPHNVASPAVDGSCMLPLADGFATRWAHGIDVVITYGPLGWVPAGIFLPGLFIHSIIIEMTSKVLMAYLLTCYAFELPGWARPVLFVAAVAGFAREDALLWLVVLVVAEQLLAPAPRLRRALGLAVLAYVGLVKLSFLYGTLVALGLLVITDRRAGAEAIALFAVVFVALWRACTGAFEGLVGWLGQSLDIVVGYSGAMGLEVRPVWELSLAIAVLALLTGARTRALAPRALSAFHAVLAVLLLKQGFVRHDGYHVGMFWSFLIVAAVPAEKGTGRTGRALVVVSAIVALAMLSDVRDVVALVRAPVTTARYLASLSACRAGLEAQFALYQSAYALPRTRALVGGGAVDMLPANEQALIVFNRLAYRPRPVYQSYCAYTPHLLELNAEHFRGPRAPDFVLFKPGTIDGRLPGLDDSLALDVIARRYEPIGDESGFQILRLRTTSPATPESPRVPLTTLRLALGEVAPLSAGQGHRWLAARVELSLAGRLLGSILKPPEIWIDLGAAGSARFLPATGRVGAPLPDAATSLAFRTRPGFGWCFSEPVVVELSRAWR